MQSRAFHGMEVAALCPDTKRAPLPLVRLRKTTRVCLPVSSSSPILTARPSFSPNISLFILPTFERKSEYEYFSASCTTSNRQFRPFAFLANGIAPPPVWNSWNAVKTRFKEARRRFPTGLSRISEQLNSFLWEAGNLSYGRDALSIFPNRWNFIRAKATIIWPGLNWETIERMDGRRTIYRGYFSNNDRVFTASGKWFPMEPWRKCSIS